jgi:hypothetical protein
VYPVPVVFPKRQLLCVQHCLGASSELRNVISVFDTAFYDCVHAITGLSLNARTLKLNLSPPAFFMDLHMSRSRADPLISKYLLIGTKPVHFCSGCPNQEIGYSHYIQTSRNRTMLLLWCGIRHLKIRLGHTLIWSP